MTVEEAIEVLKKDIKCCTDNPCIGLCEPGGCPYFIGDGLMIEAEHLAIQALEKQIAKPVRITTSTKRCSRCGRQRSNSHIENR